MATAEMRSAYAPLIGGTAYRAGKFDTPYGLRPDVEKKEVILKQEPERLPRIVLKDSTGHQLNTFTTLQEAIYRAELNVRKSRIGATAQEWRLPHGPLPAKPDYSRAGPTISTYRQKINNLKRKNRRVAKSFPEYPIYKEVDVDDVAFVAESLNHLPHVPSLSFLRQEFLAQPKRYFPIVHSILLHQKLLSETDRRDPEYTFPGFCFGCRQHMLCPGCDRTSKPHYHLDKLYKTTGGLPQARTLQEELKKHYGDNWRLTLPDLLVRKTSKVPSLTKEERQLIEEELDRTLRTASEQGQKGFLPPIPSASGQDDSKKSAETASVSIDTEDEGILADRQSLGFNDDDAHTLSSHDQDRGRRGSRGQSSDYDIDKDSDSEGVKYKGSGPRSGTTGSGREIDDDDDMSGYASSQRTERKARLYKAPAAFKLKQRKKRMLKSQSPFTADRNLNVPTGPGFKLKQNSKNATKFVDFERKDHSWKEPNKFELQKSAKDGTKFWSPKSQKKKKTDKHGRHTSPDSGLDSDKMTESEETDLSETIPCKPVKEVDIFIPKHSTENSSENSDSEIDQWSFDLDPVLLTSAEPSLDLHFDAAVDLDKVDFIIEDLPEVDSLQKKSRKKHKKKRKKTEVNPKQDIDGSTNTERGDHSSPVLLPIKSAPVDHEDYSEKSEIPRKHKNAMKRTDKISDDESDREDEVGFVEEDSRTEIYPAAETQQRGQKKPRNDRTKCSEKKHAEYFVKDGDVSNDQKLFPGNEKTIEHKKHKYKRRRKTTSEKQPIVSEMKDSDCGVKLHQKSHDLVSIDSNTEELYHIRHRNVGTITKESDQDDQENQENSYFIPQENIIQREDTQLSSIETSFLVNIDGYQHSKQTFTQIKQERAKQDCSSSEEELITSDTEENNVSGRRGDNHSSRKGDNLSSRKGDNLSREGREFDLDIFLTHDGKIRSRSEEVRSDLLQKEEDQFGNRNSSGVEKIEQNRSDIEGGTDIQCRGGDRWTGKNSGVENRYYLDNIVASTSDMDRAATHQSQGHSSEKGQGHLEDCKNWQEDGLEKKIEEVHQKKNRKKGERRKHRKHKRGHVVKIKQWNEGQTCTDEHVKCTSDNISTHTRIDASSNNQSVPFGDGSKQSDTKSFYQDQSVEGLSIEAGEQDRKVTDLNTFSDRESPLMNEHILGAKLQQYNGADLVYTTEEEEEEKEDSVSTGSDGDPLSVREVADDKYRSIDKRHRGLTHTDTGQGLKNTSFVNTRNDGEGLTSENSKYSYEENGDEFKSMMEEYNSSTDIDVFNEKDIQDNRLNQKNQHFVVYKDVNMKDNTCQNTAYESEVIDNQVSKNNSEVIEELNGKSLIRRKIVKKEKKKDVLRPSQYRLKLQHSEGTKKGSELAHLEGIAEKGQKNKSFPDADEFANTEDEVLTFMSTIRSDTESTDKIIAVRSEVKGEQLPQNSEDFEETEHRQPLSRDTESQKLNIPPQGDELNASNDVVETKDLQHSISRSSQEQNFGLTNNEADFANLNATHNQASEKESENVSNTKLLHGTDSLSKSTNQNDRSDSNVKETLDLITQDSVSNKTKDSTNITQNSSESIGTDLRSIGSVASNTHNASDDSQSLDLNTHDASDNDHKLTDLAYLDQRTLEVSELENVIKSENSGSLNEADINDTLNEDRQEHNSFTDTQHSAVESSHSALKQEVNSDPDCKGDPNLHLHIRSFGESLKEDDQEMPPTPLSEKPKPRKFLKNLFYN